MSDTCPTCGHWWNRPRSFALPLDEGNQLSLSVLRTPLRPEDQADIEQWLALMLKKLTVQPQEAPDATT